MDENVVVCGFFGCFVDWDCVFCVSWWCYWIFFDFGDCDCDCDFRYIFGVCVGFYCVCKFVLEFFIIEWFDWVFGLWGDDFFCWCFVFDVRVFYWCGGFCFVDVVGMFGDY